MKERSLNSIEEKPSVVRVFGKNFYILYSSLLEGGMTDLGLTHFNVGIVNIIKEQTTLEEKDTLLHEFIHVVDQTMECGLDERQVTTLAHGLIGIFQDNPEFAEYITRRVNE
jgi:hypothetical protein